MSVQGTGQHRGPPAQFPNQLPQYASDMFGQPSANAVIAMPPGTSYTETSRDGHTMVDITMNTNGMPAPNMQNINYVPRPVYMMPPYQMYSTMYSQVPVVTSMPQPNPVYPMQHSQPQIPQQQQPRQPPPAPRQKKILQFIDPSTGNNVLGDKSDPAKPAAAEPPKSESTSPAPASVSETVRSGTDEIRHKFTQGIAAAFQQTMKITDAPKQEQTSESEKSVSKETTPASDTVVNEEKVVEPEPEADVPEKEPTPVSTESGPRRSLSEGGERADETPAITVQEAAEGDAIEDDSEATDVVTPQKEDKKALLAEYEQKVVEFTQNSTNVSNITKFVYTRDLIELLRQIIKKFKTVPCPLSEEKLKEFLIDRSTMPPAVHSSGVNRSKYQLRGDNFNPTWAPSNKSGKTYIGRVSDTRGKKNSAQRAPFAGRTSIQRQPVQKLQRGKDAWVPSTIAQKTGAEDVADRIEKVRKDIRGLLNKITPSTYDELSREFINKKVWQDQDTLPTVVELIFTKAVEEPTFVGVYSDLCRLQHEAESNHVGAQKEKQFHTTVVRKCQNIFEGTTQTPAQAALQRVEEKLAAEEDAKKKELLKEEIEELKGKEKRYMLGTIKFISHLYRINLLNWKVIHFCIISLLRKADESGSELDIEFSLNLLESVGLFTNPNDRSRLDEFVSFVTKFKPKVSNRVRFMILGLEDLRSKGWESKNQGPKTKEEVKADVIKEEAQNKRERDAYEVNTLKKPYTGRPSGPTPYTGRPSKDNKNDRKAAAVIAASTTGGSIKKDLKLQSVEKTEKLGSQPWRANKKQPARQVEDDGGWQTVTKKDPSFERKSNSSANLKDAANQKDVSRSASITPPPANTDPSSSQ